MFALRCLAGCIVWVSIFGIIGFVAGMGAIFLYNSGKLSAYSQYTGALGIPTSTTNSSYDIYAYICFGIAGVLLIVLMCCCSRIRLAVAVCKAAGQFVATVCLIVLVPIWQTLLVACLWIPGIVAIVYLASSATFTHVGTDVFTSISSYTDEKLIYLYYFVFGTLWTNALLQAMGIFVIASACTMWYYSHGPGQELDSPILRSYKMSIRYHLGSLAFGSFILAVVQFLELVVEAFKKQAEASGADKNPCF
jgi:choline transporter-like protein 2/4/5